MTTVTVVNQVAKLVVEGGDAVAVVTPEVRVATVGEQGPPGPGTDKHYLHVQATAATVWTIPHSLDKYPTVAAVDSLQRVILGEVQYVDLDSLTITFSVAVAGKAYCN